MLYAHIEMIEDVCGLCTVEPKEQTNFSTLRDGLRYIVVVLMFILKKIQGLTLIWYQMLYLSADYGLDSSYHVAWLGVEKAREAMHGDYLTSFDQLR
ncbi:hypothetical protein ACSBR2_004963 [Camellia fascicularis]